MFCLFSCVVNDTSHDEYPVFILSELALGMHWTHEATERRCDKHQNAFTGREYMVRPSWPLVLCLQTQMSCCSRFNIYQRSIVSGCLPVPEIHSLSWSAIYCADVVVKAYRLSFNQSCCLILDCTQALVLSS